MAPSPPVSTSGAAPPVPDHAVRAAVLDPTRSFLLQAPAGSGKTELLVRRIVALLARVEVPEQIVAITFTRKAAAEMRDRVLQALAAGRVALPSDAPPHAREGHALAVAANAHTDRQGWALDANPARLRIRTIDSLQAALATGLPWLSRLGGQPRTVDDASALYLEAARRVLAELDADDASPALRIVVQHLDNHHGRLETLLADMLARRDLWLDRLPDDVDAWRDTLEATLAAWMSDALAPVLASFEVAERDALLASARHVASQVSAGAEGGGATEDPDDDPGAIRALARAGRFPDATPDDRRLWRGVAALCLTSKGTARKTVDSRSGFPAKPDGADAATQKRFADARTALIATVKGWSARDAAFAPALARVRHLSAPRYPEADWAVLRSLVPLLRRAVAHLKVVFAERGEIDHAEVGAAARAALGDPDAPSELALALDRRVLHVLVDEFQDTSRAQLDLIERLVAGWSAGDGRTLFAVGDPMQSIYRFRDADVGLFLEARARGEVAGVAVECLQLQANFRAAAGLVEWVDAHFGAILGHTPDIAAGRVPHVPAVAVRARGHEDAVVVHPIVPPDRARMAHTVVDIVRRRRVARPDARIAVLVRSRPAIGDVLAQLRAADLRAQAVDFEPLAQRAVVRDVLALARALAHPADRIAWLAVLRAPWCGLRLHDLAALVGEADAVHMPVQALAALVDPAGGHVPSTPEAPPPSQTDADPAKGDSVASTMPAQGADDRVDASARAAVAALSEDGRVRARRVADVLLARLRERARRSLREHTESAWIALGGPAVVDGAGDLADARTLLDLLDAHADGHGGVDFAELERALVKLYAAVDPQADDRLQVMTVHGAKGLEFDHVVLAALEHPGQRDPEPLLRVVVRTDGSGDPRLALSPVRAAVDDTATGIGAFLDQLDRERAQHEVARLLYVGATRARDTLDLVGALKRPADPKQRPAPRAGSLLAHLWGAVGRVFVDAVDATVDAPAAATSPAAPTGVALRRVPSGWVPPALPPAAPAAAGAVRAAVDADADADPSPLRDDTVRRAFGSGPLRWTGVIAKHVGTVVHALLQRVAEDGLARWDAARVAAQAAHVQRDLEALGVPGAHRDPACARVIGAVQRALDDPRGRFVLDTHRDGRCEWRLTSIDAGRVVHLAIDRTFVTADGVRWIVDYKTSEPGERSVADFLAAEQAHYRDQLDRYARLLQRLEPARRVQLALYFPLVDGGWCTWPAPAAVDPVPQAPRS
ncbi:MAG: UvrD-helicase domain-containing protein [Burkholderiales bacterium]|nr:UvrD-helicase domain-containing protein [Burkholderiales bacterium]